MPTGSDAPAPIPPQSISPARRRTIFAILAVIVLGHLYDTATGIEHWPFSPYPMYAGTETGPEITDVRLVGIPADSPSTQLDLLQTNSFSPLTNHDLLALLRTADLSARHGNPTPLTTLMQDALKYYNSTKNNHSPLAALRLYEWQWTTDPWARNAQSPNRKTLIYEARPAPN